MVYKTLSDGKPVNSASAVTNMLHVFIDYFMMNDMQYHLKRLNIIRINN